MNFEQAINILKSGAQVTRNGRTIVLRRGLVDVTDQEPVQYRVSEEDRAAEDWEIATERIMDPTVSPEIVDEVLQEFTLAPEAVDEIL